MYTYGYIREATLAHLDLDESEALAMNVLKRFPVFANEAIQAISAVRPAYKYFKAKIVKAFRPLVQTIDEDFNIELREATDDELLLIQQGKNEFVVADEVSTKMYYAEQDTYLLKDEITMPEDFLAFTNKQSYKLIKKHREPNFDLRAGDWGDNSCDDYYLRQPVNYQKEVVFTPNKITFLETGEYYIPYKAAWFVFKSGLSDYDELDIPLDVVVCIPLYIASQALQIDYAQKAQIKRQEFEVALSRITATNNMEVNKIGTIC